MNTLQTDILILGAGGAGLFAALHAKKANPDLDVTIAVKGRSAMVSSSRSAWVHPASRSCAIAARLVIVTAWTVMRASPWSR